MADYCFDTTVFVDYFHGNRKAKDFMDRIFDESSSASFSVITEAELWMGLSNAQEQLRHEAILNLMERQNVDMGIARRAGHICSKMSPQNKPEKPKLPDALIAVSAASRGEKLVTRNKNDFEQLAQQGIVECEFY